MLINNSAMNRIKYKYWIQCVLVMMLGCSTVHAQDAESIRILGVVRSDLGSISISASGGTLPYSYRWANNQGVASIITSKIPGKYTATVTDSRGRIASKTYSIAASLRFQPV